MAKQAYKQSSLKEIAAPLGKTIRVIKPADDLPAESKRADLIERAEDDLEKEMEVLKEGTRLRNLELLRRMEAIREQGRVWETMLESEMKARDEEHGGRMLAFEKAFASTRLELKSNTTNVFDAFENDAVPPHEQRRTVWNENFRQFVDVQVPKVVEELQGNVVRQLQKSHETFHIDNTKLLKREKRIVDRFENHQQNTQRWFTMEGTKRHEKFRSLTEDMNNTMRVDDRQTESSQGSNFTTLVAVKSELDTESSVRNTEDMEILEKLSDAMAALQTSILTNFGQSE